MTLENLLRRAGKDHSARIAVDGDRRLTYGELLRESEALAGQLRNLGVRRGERVLLNRPKGAEGVVGMLGILLAGGAYVPVDPETPAERLRQIIEDAQPRARVGEKVEGSPSEEPAPSVREAGDLAAILYTSGSTGRPKGVCLTDGNILHFVEWMVREFRVRESDRLSNHAPYHFDLSLFDHFGAFRCGATVVPVPKEHAAFPVNLARWIGEKRISVWYSVPFALVGLAERGALSKVDLSALRLVLFAGEVFPMPSLRRLRAQLPGVEMANLFGPTETNVCLFHRLQEGDVDGEELPVGIPAPGFEIRLDENGGLLVRGPGVTSGYWGGASREPGEFYDTGDRVQERGGLLWFRGRKDRMAKIRGYRVEPGDVEAALRQVRGVREAAVLVVPELHGQHSLEAAIVAETGVEGEQVAAALRERLPVYMIPSRIRKVERIPRTTTGKVDYQELSRR